MYKAGDDVVSALLHNRGIGKEGREEFLHPPAFGEYIKRLPADFKESLKKAREEILASISQNIPIIIHGDYDADGICATAILYKTLTQTLNYSKVAYFIPNRFDHGYGLSADSVKEMAGLVATRFGDAGGQAHHVDQIKALVITVDCGITAEEQVLESAHEEGFKVIITDHHQKRADLPKADVLLWNDGMVGAGVALMLAVVLGLKDEQLLCLAGIATVTDLIPLKGFNRALVKKSLSILNTNPPLGVKKLIEVAGRSNGELTVYDLGYIVGPRLNATGRLESAYDSLKLLLENDAEKLTKIAQKLNAVNLERQEMTQKMYDLADSLVVKHTTKDSSALDSSITGEDYLEPNEQITDKLIVVTSPEFHEGVIGLVAGKLAQKYSRPTIVVSINGGTAKGSARSVAGVNIIELLRHFEGRFMSLGGHPMAAGFSVKQENLNQLIADLKTYARETILDDLLIPQLAVDLELPLSLVSVDLLTQIDQLKPYGIGNPEPVFVSRNVGVAGSNFVGKDGFHLSLKLFDGTNYYKGIMFDAKNLGISGFNFGDRIDVAYIASLKSYNGETLVDLVIKDVLPLPQA